MTRSGFKATARRIVFGAAFAVVLAVGCGGETNNNPPLPPGAGGFVGCVTNQSTTDAGGTTGVDGGNGSDDGGNSGDDGGTVACNPNGNGNGTGSSPTTTTGPGGTTSTGNGGTIRDGGIGTGTGRGTRPY